MKTAHLVLALSSTVTPAGAQESLSITPGFAVTFGLETAPGRELSVAAMRQGKIGLTEPAPGELTGLAGPGGAVQLDKLHVFERTAKAIVFTATASAGPRTIAAERVCGHLDMDSWVTFPPATTRVVLSHFRQTDQPCD